MKHAWCWPIGVLPEITGVVCDALFLFSLPILNHNDAEQSSVSECSHEIWMSMGQDSNVVQSDACGMSALA